MKTHDDNQNKTEEAIIREIQQILAKNRQGMTISDISRSLGINRTLILNILNLMTGRGEISMRSFGRAKVYTLSSRIPVARLLSLSSDLFLIVDEDLFVEDVNDPCASFFNVQPDEVRGSNIRYTGIPELFSYDIIRALEDAVAGNKRIFEDYVGMEGKECFFRVSCIPIQENDFSTKVALVLHDLTLHKKYEEELEERLNIQTRELSSSLHRYETLAEVAPVGIFEADAKGKVIYVNQKWCEITGYEPDEVKGSKWVKVIHHTERDWIKGLWYEHVAEGIPWNHAYRYQKKSGEEVHVLGMAVPLRNDDGEVTGYLGTVVDITDRVTAEQIIHDLNVYLTTILEDANDGILTLDNDRRFVSCNAAGCRILGYEKSILTGQSIRMIYRSDEEFEKIGEKIYREITMTGHYRGEIPIIRGDGEERIIDVSISDMKEHGTITGIIVLFRDVTESSREKKKVILQENQLKKILDGLIDAVCVVDRNGTILYANSCACTYMTGSESLERENMTLFDLFPEEEVISLLSYYQRIIDSKKPDSKRMKVTLRGQEYCFFNRSVPIQFGENNIDAVLSLSLETGVFEHV